MRTFLLIIISCCILSCASDTSNEREILDEALTTFQKNPTDDNAKSFNTAYRNYVAIVGQDDPSLPPYILENARLAKERNKLNHALSFYQTYFTRFPDHPEVANRLAEAISLIEAFQKPPLSQVFYKSFVNRFPTHPSTKDLASKISSPEISIDSNLRIIRNLIANPETQQPDLEKIQLYIEMTEISVIADPGFKEGPEHLLYAAEEARKVKLHARAIKMLNFIERLYPTHEKVEEAVFKQGNIYLNDIKNLDKAITQFEKYKTEFPNGLYMQSVTIVLDSLNKLERKREDQINPQNQEVEEM